MANTSLKRWHLVQDLSDEKNVDMQDQGEEHSKQGKGILKDPEVGKFLECAGAESQPVRLGLGEQEGELTIRPGEDRDGRRRPRHSISVVF